MKGQRTIKTPEVRFKFGRLVQNVFKAFRDKIPETISVDVPSWDKTKILLDERRNLWGENGDLILKELQILLGLNFYQDTIDIFFVHNWKRAISEPLIIGFDYEGDAFVDILTHEIIHRLLMDNREKINGNRWAAEQYPDETDPSVINHILVHAVHKEIYLNTLKSPDRLRQDIERCQVSPGYVKAWDIVERDGHMNIIEKFKLWNQLK